MSLRNLNGNAHRCWARRDGLLCEKAPGHFTLHECDGVQWSDHGLGPTVDVDLDNYGDGAA